jgi:hypothetical protein
MKSSRHSGAAFVSSRVLGPWVSAAMLVAEAHAPTHLRHEFDRLEQNEMVNPVRATDLVHLTAKQLPIATHRSHQFFQLAGCDVAGLP